MSSSSITPRLLELLRFTEVHQRHAEALARATGEHFNIFDILGIRHLEVKTHSPILGELLNPKGRHGQGAVFLRLFLVQFGIEGFDTESPIAKVELEYQVRGMEKSGGRIDIAVTDGREGRILIENKIYAWDQDNQMEHYRDAGRNAQLFYLTLDGRPPSNRTQAELDRIQCKCIEELVRKQSRIGPDELAAIMGDRGPTGVPDGGSPCAHDDYFMTTASLQWFPASRRVRVSYTSTCAARYVEIAL